MSKIKKDIMSLPSLEDVQKFEMLFPLIVNNLSEVRELSKKKQDEPLNKFKVGKINRKLIPIKEILKNEPTNEYLEILDGDILPSNSDAVLTLSEFKAAMDQYKKKYYTLDSEDTFSFEKTYSWKTE